MEAAVLFFRFRRNGTTIAPTVLVICRFDCYLVAKLRSVHKVYIEMLMYENDTLPFEASAFNFVNFDRVTLM